MAEQVSSIDWDDLKVFLAIARTRSLRGAARRLGLNHATVARRLAALETALAARFFERGPEGLGPTAAGEALVGPAERVEEQLLVAERQVAGRDAALSGRLRLSLPYALMRGFLAEDLADFAGRFPGIELAVELTDSFSDLARREADVSTHICLARALPPSRKRLGNIHRFFRSMDLHRINPHALKTAGKSMIGEVIILNRTLRD